MAPITSRVVVITRTCIFASILPQLIFGTGYQRPFTTASPSTVSNLDLRFGLAGIDTSHFQWAGSFALSLQTLGGRSRRAKQKRRTLCSPTGAVLTRRL